MDVLKAELKYNNPYLKLRNNRQDIDMLFKDLSVLIDNNIKVRFKSLLALESRLQLLNPLLALDSGYGILIDESGDMIKSVEALSLNDSINIKIKDAVLKVIVKEIKKES